MYSVHGYVIEKPEKFRHYHPKLPKFHTFEFKPRKSANWLRSFNSKNFCKMFKLHSHTITVLKGLNRLRTDGLLHDVKLVAEGETFPVHRAVLASCSDYFHAMFTDNMRESHQQIITLNGVTGNGLRLLLEYIYTGCLDLNMSNVQDVLSAASHIQLNTVVDDCSIYLKSILDLENCVDIATISELYSLGELGNYVYQFMSVNLFQFSQTDDFKELSRAQMARLLSSNYPVDCCELDVKKIVVKWHLLNGTHGKKSDLLKYVNHAEIERGLHWNELESFSHVSVGDHWNNRDDPSNCLVNSRGMEIAIVKVGGFNMGGVTNEVTYYLESCRKWKYLTKIPHLEQSNFGAAVLGNFLYVVGGCFDQSLQENIHPFGFRYNPLNSRWSTITPMLRERCRFSLNVINGRLCAIGGISEIQSGPDGNYCEIYDPATDAWTAMAPLPDAISQHAAATVVQGEDSFLYISGGCSESQEGFVHVLDSIYRYSARADNWTHCANMITKRADHTMLVIGGKLYICGGWYEDEGSDTRIFVNTIDVFDTETNTSRIITTIPTPRYHTGIVAVRNKIFFIGGFHSDTLFDRASSGIEYYDVEENVWSTIEDYPQDIWEHTCVTMYVPMCREDMEVIRLARNNV